uniref:Uncharacterized protein n=1 Tax=Alexandrium catenella TaxID=2925 RepID=A0A7S1S229_ALECA
MAQAQAYQRRQSRRPPAQRAPAGMKLALAASLLCLALLAGGAQGSRIGGKPRPTKPRDNSACRSVCNQPSGIEFLAAFWKHFEGVTDPTACCGVCDKVLPPPISAMQLSKGAPPTAAPVAAAEPQTRGGKAGPAPVKR